MHLYSCIDLAIVPVSDFDNSDEDIASLLADDEDDVFTKKTFSTSPEKKTTKSVSDISPKKSTSLPKQEKLKQESFEKTSLKSSPIKKHGVSKTSSKELSDTDDDDALNDLLSDSSMPSFLRDTKKSPVKKSASKSNASFGDESGYLEELGFSKLSSDSVLKNQRKSSILSGFGDGDHSEDNDILKSLGSNDISPPSPKRKGSFFDDFLKTLSPKQSPKKSMPPSPTQPKKQNEKDENHFDDDILGKVASKSKTSNQSQRQSTPENKRETLTKQVSFKDLPETSPIHESSIKERKASVKQESESEIKATNKITSQPRRSEKMGAEKHDGTDWLSFFKESPKETPKPSEADSKLKSSLSEESSVPNDFKANTSRRRSSSADWLGLSESTLTNDKSVGGIKQALIKDVDIGSDVLPTRPHTTGSSASSKPKRKIADDLSWLGEDSKSDSLERRKKIPEAEYSSKDPIYLSGENVPLEVKDLKLESKKRIALPSKASLNRQIPTNTAKPLLKTAVNTIAQNTSEFNAQGIETPLRESNFSQMHENTHNIMPKAVYLEEKSQIIGETNDYALQAIINNHALEREQLMKSTETLKQMYDERIKAIESLHRDQLKSLEESLKSNEAKLKLEIDSITKTYEEKIYQLQGEKKLIEKDRKEKLEITEKQNLSEIRRLKDLHSQSIESMKRDHDDALSRLQRLKEQEIEAILSTQSHSRSLQHLAEQLESSTAELASLQSKVDGRNQTTLREKQLLLESKERDLKNLEIRLQRQLADGDEERSRLQQLVLRLENRLQKNTTESEEERWEVQQLKARLVVQQKHLEEEYKLKMEQVEKEKEKIRLSKDTILHEQKTVLQQLAQERQHLMQEKTEINSLSKKLKEEETKFHVKKLKEESFIERQKVFIQQEESRLQFEKSYLKQEADQLERERNALLIEKQLLKEEKMKFNDLSFKLRRKENEVETLAMNATEERERAKIERVTVDKIKSEHQFRMQQMTQKMQALMEKEHQILEEKEKLAEEKFVLDNQKNSVLCNKCNLSLGFPVNAPPSAINNIPFNAASAPANHQQNISTPRSAFPGVNGVSNQVLSSHIDPSLIVWYITAKNDREYLQGELSFLKSLKDSKK